MYMLIGNVVIALCTAVRWCVLLVFVSGPKIVSRIRPDLIRKFAELFDDDTVSNYIFHCNAQEPR